MGRRNWAMAGSIFAIASVVMIILTFNQFQSYYVVDVSGENDPPATLYEVCEKWYEDEGDELDLDIAIWCEPEQQENYQMIWQLLISLGLTIICFSKNSKTRNKPKQDNEQSVAQQRYQQPPLD